MPMNPLLKSLAPLITVALMASPLLAVDDTQPNFLFLLSDDQAWNGLSCPMHPEVAGAKSAFIQTPNLARLANQGMRFSAAYSPASVCSPTRISLQTGKSPAQCQWTKAAPSVTAADGFKLIPPQSRKNIDAAETTIGEMLKSAGYATAHYGKWHLGGGGPENHGYDESDGDTGNQDAAPHVEPNPVDIFGMGSRASAFMEKNVRGGKPFFIQMSYHALHYPENATKALVEKYRKLAPNGNDKEIGRAAMAEDLDRGVGELMAKIDELGIADNTYVIYMSDNGGSTRGALQGGKGGVWEGGIRVPLIVRGPGIAPDSWCHQRVVGYDLFNTFCELAGVAEALPSVIEGGSITHLLRGGNEPVKRPHEELVFHFPHYQGDAPHTALLLGNFKLMRFYEDNSLLLFDLDADLAESHNLAGEMPDRVRAMAERMDAYLKEMKAAMPVPHPGYDPENPPSREESKGGGEEKKKGGKGGSDGGGKGGENRSPLLEALDTDGNREISEDEMRQAKKSLLSLDRDADGQLDNEEFTLAENGERGGMRPPREDGGQPRIPWILVHATEIDADGDGVVEFEAEMMVEALRVFAAYDQNGDRKITLDESSARGGMPKSALGGFVKEHALELDRNQDGGISREELTGLFAKFFGEADKNGDQKLTRDEYKIEGGVAPRFPDQMKPKAPPEAAFPTSEGAPNFVVFLIDDMGWNAMGYTGNTWIETPRTDAMAAEGMIFTNAYASAPNCAPTRACLMSGQYPPRHGVYTVVDERHSPGLPHHKVLAAHSNAELATESVTIAESLKAGGYATGMMGMWNLGRGKDGPTTPLGQGFEVFKQPRDLGFDKDLYFNAQGEYLTDALTTEGIRWMEANRDKPFFLYLAYHGVHSPFQPKTDLLRKYQEKPGGTGAREEAEYAATVEAIDQNVGRIVDALEQMGLSEDTIVVFHSDNGGTRQYIEPLAGGKGTVYEGGLRVPTAVWGPGIVKGTTAEPMLTMDIYPTLLDFAGIESPAHHRLDGESLAPLLTGKADRLKREAVFWHFPSYIGGGGPSSAMRKGDWKVIEQFETQSFEIYDLAHDPTESRNLFDAEPDKARELIADLRTWQDETGATRPIEVNPNYDPKAKPERGREQRGKGKE